jgi:hypothetical protein
VLVPGLDFAYGLVCDRRLCFARPSVGEREASTPLLLPALMFECWKEAESYSFRRSAELSSEYGCMNKCSPSRLMTHSALYCLPSGPVPQLPSRTRAGGELIASADNRGGCEKSVTRPGCTFL